MYKTISTRSDAEEPHFCSFQIHLSDSEGPQGRKANTYPPNPYRIHVRSRRNSQQVIFQEGTESIIGITNHKAKESQPVQNARDNMQRRTRYPQNINTFPRFPSLESQRIQGIEGGRGNIKMSSRQILPNS